MFAPNGLAHRVNNVLSYLVYFGKEWLCLPLCVPVYVFMHFLALMGRYNFKNSLLVCAHHVREPVCRYHW